MTVNYFDTLITTENPKASGFFEYHAKASTVTCHEALQQNLLMLKAAKEKLLRDKAGLKSDLENP